MMIANNNTNMMIHHFTSCRHDNKSWWFKKFQRDFGLTWIYSTHWYLWFLAFSLPYQQPEQDDDDEEVNDDDDDDGGGGDDDNDNDDVNGPDLMVEAMVGIRNQVQAGQKPGCNYHHHGHVIQVFLMMTKMLIYI